MTLKAHNGKWRCLELLLALCLLLSGCHFKGTSSAPVITFSKIPPAAIGGPEKLDIIEGHVKGARADQQIVLYARSAERWWVQPYTDRPFTKIHSDSSWTSETHLGSDYAALLVTTQYTPLNTTKALPQLGGGVVAVAVVKGSGSGPTVAVPKTVNFSGYTWTITSGGNNHGGSHILFDPDNVWTDARGALHLRIAKREGKWTSAEVRLTRSLGYGTYKFKVGDVSHLEPSAILSLFEWDDVGSEDNRRELDIEIGRWGLEHSDNAQFVVQPYYIPVNISRFQVPKGVLTYSFHWQLGQAMFTTAADAPQATAGRIISQHVFTSGVPSPGEDSVRMNLYALDRGQVPLQNGTEVVIEKFEYLP